MSTDRAEAQAATIEVSLDILDRLVELVRKLRPEEIHGDAGRMLLYHVPADAPAACWKLFAARYSGIALQIETHHCEYVRIARSVLCSDDPTQPVPRLRRQGGKGLEP